MDCNEFSSLLEGLRDGESAEDRAAMEAHAKTCAKCRMALDLRELYAGAEVPSPASARWRAAVRNEEAQQTVIPIQKKFQWRKALSVAAAVVFIGAGAAMVHQNNQGASTLKYQAAGDVSESSYDAGNTLYLSESVSAPRMAMSAADTAYMAEKAVAADAAQTEKIIRTVSLTVKTDDFDGDLTLLKALAKEQGGRVESERVSGDQASGTLRSASITLRIPAEALDTFLTGAQGVKGRVTSSSQSSEDVSDTYYDVKSRLDTQTAKMERLRELMTKAETVSDLIELENAVTDTQYLIDSYTGQLNGYDDKVQYSTVSLSLKEERVRDTAQDTALTFWQRVENGLRDSVEAIGVFLSDAAVFLVIAAPWLLILAVIVAVIVVIRKHNHKKQEEKKNV